jgi:hypothetical protein
MAPITPWLATLIETELENVIAWKSIVKPDPDADGAQRSRFSDDGSNLRSVVGASQLDSDSTIQLLEVSRNQKNKVRFSSLTFSQRPGSNARAKIPISDGEVSVLAILSDTAWDAYDKGLEEGEEARKGDLLLCKKLTVVSTTYGPSEERIKLRLEDLELTGNFRKVIGQPSPLLERPSIIASREKIEDLRLRQLQSEVLAEDDHEDVSADEDEVIKIEPGEENEADVDDEDQTGNNAVGVPADAANAPHEPSPADVALPEKLPPTASRMPPPNRTSPATHYTASAQLESQLPLDVTPTQTISQPRNPVRRTRGGFSMGREGFEPTRGDNLTGPQAPTLHARHARLSETPPKPKLLDVISMLPNQVPKKRSPEPSVPIPAQVVNEEVVVETPTKAKRTSAASTSHESTPVPRKRYRIPRDQKALLENPSSWIPPAPGHQFPHPNVPISLLTAWNAKATGAGSAKPPSQSSPIPEIEQSSEVKSLPAVQTEPQATAAAEIEDDSDESEYSDTSDDRPLSGWSASPSRSQALPPDSSAAHISPRVSRPVSRETAVSGSERMPISIADDGASTSFIRSKSIAGSSNRNGEVPRWKMLGSSDRVISRPIAHKAPSSSHSTRDQSPRAPGTPQSCTGIDVKPDSERVCVPSSSLRSPALPIASQSPATPLGSSNKRAGDALERPAGQSDRRQAPGASQPMSASMRRSQLMADNFHGPMRPSTQQTSSYRRRTFDAKEHAVSSTNPVTPLGPPPGQQASTGSRSSTYDRRDPSTIPSGERAGPKSWRGSQSGVSDRRSNGSISERDRVPAGDFYRPSQLEPRGDRVLSRNHSADRPRPSGTQTPNSTNEMESAVPRALPPNYHQARSNFYRNEQQRQW